MKVRKRKYASGKVAYQFDAGVVVVNGKRRRQQRSFPTKAAAARELAKMRKAREKQGAEAFDVSTSDRVRYQAAARRLAEVGMTLEQAVDLACAHGKPVIVATTLRGLWELYKADLERKGREPEWIWNLAVSVRSFILGREERDPRAVTRADVSAWISANGWSPKTQKNYLGVVSAMFTWAQLPNPCKGIETARLEDREPVALPVDACERLLTTALSGRGAKWDAGAGTHSPAPIFRTFLGYVVLAMFGGVRPKELERSSRAALDLAGGVFIVRAAVAKPGRGKTRRRRVVDLPANAIAWLRLWNELCPGDWIKPPNFQEHWKALRELAQCWPWPHDVLRHTCATMHYAIHQKESILKALLGHSKDEETLFEFYRAVQLPDGRLVTKAMAEKFYAIMPPPVAMA